jgi:hypothetical protein
VHPQSRSFARWNQSLRPQPKLQLALLRLSVVSPIVADHLRRGFGHFKLGAHFLDLGHLLIETRSELRNCRLEVLLLLRQKKFAMPSGLGSGFGGDPLDREVQNMIDERDLEKGFPGCKGPCDKLFTYLRYNAELSKTGLERLGVGHLNPEHVQQMDSVDYIGEMQELGQALAQQKVKAEHFAGFPPAS